LIRSKTERYYVFIMCRHVVNYGVNKNSGTTDRTQERRIGTRNGGMMKYGVRWLREKRKKKRLRNTWWEFVFRSFIIPDTNHPP
jgi:hypothetical protein